MTPVKGQFLRIATSGRASSGDKVTDGKLLINPWPGRSIRVPEAGKTGSVPVQLDKSNGEWLVFITVVGHKYRVEPN